MIFLELFIRFFFVGLFAIGGGLATLPFLTDMGEVTGWFGSDDISNMIAISESTPGPIGVNMATYIGPETGGFWGAVCATLGTVLPSFIIILIVARCYEKFKESKIVKGCMTGLRPTVIGLIAAAVLLVPIKVLGIVDSEFQAVFSAGAA